MDKFLIERRFSCAFDKYDDNAKVQRYAAERLCKYILELSRNFGKILEIGCGTGLFTKKFLSYFRPDLLILNDLCAEADICLPDVNVTFLQGDAEILDFPGELDLIMSCSTFQWFEDLPGFILKVYEKLLPGGILTFCTFGPRNMEEVMYLSGVGLKYFPKETLCEILENSGFELITIEEEIVEMYFESPFGVLEHLRNTGVNGVSNVVWTRKMFNDFCRSYTERYAFSSGVKLTYHPIWVVARKI